MKAVVLEIQDGVAAVLTEDGTVEKVRRECMVGETIDLGAAQAARPAAAPRAKVTAAQDVSGGPSASAAKDPAAAPSASATKDMNAHPTSAVRTLHHHARRWIATAAAVLIAFALGGGTIGYYNAYAYSYVSIDINPSFEYSLNHANKVIAVTPLNDEAEKVSDQIESKVKHENVEDAIQETIDIMYENKYLNTNENDYVLASVSSSSDKKAGELADAVAASVGTGRNDDVEVYVVTASMEDHKAAEAHGISTGRYEMVKTIKGDTAQADSDAEDTVSEQDVKAYMDVPVKKLIEDVGKTTSDTTVKKDTKTDSGNSGSSAAASDQNSQSQASDPANSADKSQDNAGEAAGNSDQIKGESADQAADESDYTGNGASNGKVRGRYAGNDSTQVTEEPSAEVIAEDPVAEPGVEAEKPVIATDTATAEIPENEDAVQ